MTLFTLQSLRLRVALTSENYVLINVYYLLIFYNSLRVKIKLNNKYQSIKHLNSVCLKYREYNFIILKIDVNNND